MAKKAAAKPRRVEPEGKEETESPGEGQEGHGRITKSEAVRRALADGVDQPADGVAYIKSHFGLEIGPQHFSAVKSSHLKKQGVATVNTRFKSTEAVPKQTPAAVPADGEADILEALEVIKPLVASLGVEKVKRLADLLG